MKSFAFTPSALTVRAGDTVRWSYDETATAVPPGGESPVFRTPVATCPGHSVTSAGSSRGRRLFNSGVHRAVGFPFAYRFTRPGTYNYFCSVHGGAHPNNPLTAMNGQITVRG